MEPRGTQRSTSGTNTFLNAFVLLVLLCGKQTLEPNPSGELGLWSYLTFAIHDEVRALVVERDEPCDLDVLGKRCLVRPSQVLERLAAGTDGPIFGEALVRAAGDGVCRSEQVHSYVGLRDVV